MSKRIKKSGFTLLELMIALFIFSAVIAITISSTTVGFLTGRTTSSEQKKLNEEITLVMQTLTSKIEAANVQQTLGDGIVVYGFKVSGASLITSSDAGCTSIGKKDTALAMKQFDCASTTSAEATSFLDDDKITSKSVKITSFELGADGQIWEYRPVLAASVKTPFITIRTGAKDAKEELSTTIQSSYSLNYENVKNFRE